MEGEERQRERGSEGEREKCEGPGRLGSRIGVFQEARNFGEKERGRS